MTEEEQAARERRAQLLAFKFAEQQLDPEGGRRQHEMERNEIRGEFLGNAILETHAAHVARKQAEQQHFADLLSGISDKRVRKA